jgi:hypothetical protein
MKIFWNKAPGATLTSRLAATATAALFSVLSACGGGDDSEPFGSANPGGGEAGGGTSAANIDSVIISYPMSNAIEDQENGFYLRKAGIALTDKYGKPAADGTRIALRIIDSVLVQGDVIDGGPDTIAGTNLVIPSAEQSDGTLAGDLTTLKVDRLGIANGSNRMIEAGDAVLLFGPGYSRDIIRNIQGPPGLIDTLAVTSAFEKSYPEYNDVSYVVGASMLGAAILGESDEGFISGEGVVSGGAGIATVWIRYPSNINYILTGCNPMIDDRITPMGSGQVYLAATAGNITAVEPFCFSTVAGYTLTPDSVEIETTTAGGNYSVPICVADGGDGVGVPFSFINVLGGGLGTVTLTGTAGGVFTNRNGCFTANIFVAPGGVSGAEGTWTFAVGDGEATVKVSIP